MESKKDFDFVDLEAINAKILIDMRYATKNNFLGRPIYSIAKCFLRRKTALKIDNIQKKLEKNRLGLKIFDGYRPLSVQKIFWEIIPDPRYCADPKKGSAHNRGAAVDVTLVDDAGKELLMPTEFDDFTEKAHRNFNNLPKKAIENRILLEETMIEQGFVSLPTEWWHFDDDEAQGYPIEDISLDMLIKICAETV
jgi:zinc D-Ala-D-Ala dipeptidase